MSELVAWKKKTNRDEVKEHLIRSTPAILCTTLSLAGI